MLPFYYWARKKERETYKLSIRFFVGHAFAGFHMLATVSVPEEQRAAGKHTPDSDGVG